MIIYNPRRCFGYIVLTSCKGSSFFSAMPLPILATLFTLAIKLLPETFHVPATSAGDEKDTAEALITHPQASYALTSIVGFLLLFRSNLAYSRFWEGRTAVQNMGAAWAEVGSLVVAFDSAAKGRDDYGEWKADFVHLLSLIHALAVMSLRTDADLSNIVPHAPYQDFDGTSYISGKPWFDDDAGTDDDDMLSRAGSTASVASRRSSVESVDSSTGFSSHPGSPHQRLRRRSASSRSQLPARPAPKSKQTGVVARSGLGSRAHYFPLGLKQASLKQLHADLAVTGPGILTPRSAVAPEASPGTSVLPRARSEESPHSIRSMGPEASHRRSTTQDPTNAAELWGPGSPSRTLRMRRSVTEGDLQHSAALGDVLADLRRGDGVPAEISGLPVLISGVQLELTPEDGEESSASPEEDDGQQEEAAAPLTGGRKRRTKMSGRLRSASTSPGGVAAPAGGDDVSAAEAALVPPSLRVDTTGDGAEDSTGFDTTGDGMLDAFDTTGDGRIDKMMVDLSAVEPLGRLPSAARHPATDDTDRYERSSDRNSARGSVSRAALPAGLALELKEPALPEPEPERLGKKKTSSGSTETANDKKRVVLEGVGHGERRTYQHRDLLDARLSKYDNTEDSGPEGQDPVFPLMVIGGLWERERERLEVVDPLHAERVYVVQSWIHHALVERYELEGLAVPAPLLAQVYGQLSCGFHAFMQCKKLVDTPFPFPYAQMVLIFLIILSVVLPVQVCIIVNSTPLAMALTFVTVWAFCGINEVAMELEEPFMDERNDIALADLHVDFSEKLLTLVNRLTWRSSWPEGTVPPTRTGARQKAPHQKLSRFASEAQQAAREAEAEAAALAAERASHAGEGGSRRARVESVPSVQP